MFHKCFEVKFLRDVFFIYGFINFFFLIEEKYDIGK